MTSVPLNYRTLWDAMDMLRPRHGPRGAGRILVLVMYTLMLAVSSGHSNGRASDDPLSGSLSSLFDESLAREIVNLTQAAYCVDQLVGWNCTVCGNFPGMKNISILHGKSRNVRGFVGVDLGTSSSISSAFGEPQGLVKRNSRAGAGLTLGLHELAGYAGPVEAVTAGQRRNLRTRDKSLASETSPGRPRVVVTFAGTDPKSIKNWIDDLEAAQTAHEYGESDCQDCKVHRGFLAAYQVVQGQVCRGVGVCARSFLSFRVRLHQSW